jgi:hypothetical protein
LRSHCTERHVYPGKNAPSVNESFTQYVEERIYYQPDPDSFDAVEDWLDLYSKYGFMVRIEALGL